MSHVTYDLGLVYGTIIMVIIIIAVVLHFSSLAQLIAQTEYNIMYCRLTGCVPSWQRLTILASYSLWQQENWNGCGKVMDARSSVRAGSHVFVSLGLEASAHYSSW